LPARPCSHTVTTIAGAQGAGGHGRAKHVPLSTTPPLPWVASRPPPFCCFPSTPPPVSETPPCRPCRAHFSAGAHPPRTHSVPGQWRCEWRRVTGWRWWRGARCRRAEAARRGAARGVGLGRRGGRAAAARRAVRMGGGCSGPAWGLGNSA
jgi:hypothetical protein